ncbi:uncharacterized protein SCHCODRAFT_02644174 [Schizophyllum commune H4-8]|uniref:uncharacterized protein n=1 Tax=Schizophyllum commune (strain H4-8 / FGSC 9210) TaxID=578458 RepID=UPI00215F12DC|nr:uncharacterized protein SCHCODRAFT_02644174 [Schizophyllum commune H4-8]KAI5885713.1 hypothetical protein SCHCODRAFT_02644174 [Schizophyllum commune H4-8]
MTDVQDPPASGGSKTFGIHKYDPRSCLGAEQARENVRRGYEGKYEDDPLYEELGDEARIWRVMLDEGRIVDAAMLQRFRDHLDVDLVFAGLFSAVLTTFVVQTSQTPSTTGDTTIALLLELIAIQRAWANDPRVDGVASFSPPPPSPSPSPWINRCWFLSLIFSLLAAFGAVVVRQWLQEYESDITGSPKRRALVRHFRRVGLENYKVHLIVPILPMLLHVSLLLFFIGLILYVGQSDPTMSHGIIALTTLIYLLYLLTNVLPVFYPQCPYRSPLSAAGYWLRMLYPLLRPLLPSVSCPSGLQWAPLCNGVEWAKSRGRQLHHSICVIREIGRVAWQICMLCVLKMPSDYEWDSVLRQSDDLIPDSLDWAMQASPDLSIAPLVVQASAGLRYEGRNWWPLTQPRTRLLRNRILPWFYNALSTRQEVFDWAPGRENELIRMADTLLLVPVYKLQIEAQFCSCATRVFQALTLALLDLPNMPTVTPIDVARMSMTLLALGRQLYGRDVAASFTRDDVNTPLETIAKAYSLLRDTHPVTGLRLRPLIWDEAWSFLGKHGTPVEDTGHFAITLWRSQYSEAPLRDNEDRWKEDLDALFHITLQEWLYLHPDRTKDWEFAINRLLCPESCEASRKKSDFGDDASRLHSTCHAIDLYIKEDRADGNAAFDDNLGFLVVRLIGWLFTTLGYDSIDSALRTIGHSAVSAAFKSSFLVHSSLSFAGSLHANARLSTTFAVSLFWFLAKMAEASVARNYKATIAIRNALDRHATDYCEVLAEALDYDEVSVELLRQLVHTVLYDHRLAFSDISDALAASLATQLSKMTDSAFSDQPEDVMTDYLYLDALCAARAESKQVDTKFPDASRKLHSAVLSLKPTKYGTWKQQQLDRISSHRGIPLAVALALKSTHGLQALDELPFLVQDPRPDANVLVPDEAREGQDLNWYRHFTSDPDKHIRASSWDRETSLHISELVSFEEAVERMQKKDAEHAGEDERRLRGGAENDTNDDAESSASEYDRLDDQGGAEHTQSQMIARLRELGAWGVAPFKRIHRFLASVRRPRHGSSFIKLNDFDVERTAGASILPGPMRSEVDTSVPAMASEAGQGDEHGQDGEHAQDGEQDQDREQDRDGSHSRVGGHSQTEKILHVQTRGTMEGTQGTAEELCAPRDAEDEGSTSVREIPDAEKRSEQDHDDEEGSRDSEHGRDDEHGRHDEHGRDDEHGRGGDHARDGQRDRDGGQDRDSAQDRNDEQIRVGEQIQAEEIPHVQTPGTEEE